MGNDDLWERARRLQIFGWEHMTRSELEAAVDTAEQEASQADAPLQEEVDRGTGQG